MPQFYPHNFGELEASIMDIIWRLGRASVKDVLHKLTKRRPAAYTTVMTVMSRLFTKGILKRELDQSGAYLYTPKQNRASFLTEASKQAVSRLLKTYGEVAVAQFFDILESGNLKKMEQWRRKLKSIK
ncbi:MAG: BlaI/MecI/CopY family transcriptional regulator [Patescibacteria group bacterium]